MRIIECYIENFGKLSGYTHKFEEGLNAVYAENGMGKTTLSVFIKAMFYGLNAERKQSLDVNDRKKYSPWQGGRYGGSLTFEVGGRVYRIERTFGTKASDDIFRLVDVASGASSSEYSENIGFELFDIDAAGFERTIFLSEKNLAGAISNDTISAKLSNLVGTTGDVGAVSGALARLEERRKFYQKRGNTGEIALLRQKISECDAAIDNLERRRLELEAKELRLSTLEREIAAVDEKASKARDAITAQKAEAAGRSYREQYVRMRDELANERAEYARLESFFEAGVPTQYEIDEARDAARDAAALRNSRKNFESEELSELRAFFRADTGFAEIESVKSIQKAETAAEAELTALKTNLSFAEQTLAEELGGKIPTQAELDACTSAAPGGVHLILGTALSFASMVMLVLGFIISPWFFIGSSTLALISSILILLGLKASKQAKEQREHIGLRSSNPHALSVLRHRIESHRIVKERDEARIAQLSEEAARYKATVGAFIAKFPHDMPSAAEAIALIEEKYSRYYALVDMAKRSSDAIAGIDIRIDHLESKARAFTDKYKTDAPDPFEEVRSRLNLYTYAKRTLVQREQQLREFALLHRISEEQLSTPSPVTDVANAEATLEECKARLISLRREQALLESEYNSELADVERLDEVEAVRASYKDKLDRYVSNLEVIMTTASMLSDASDAMTSRYIGGTKARFEHYVSLIGDDGGEFAMGADFVLKKHDRGETRVAESYSKGTRDMHAFCLRLALSDSLWGGKAPIVILDDPFSALDTEKIARAKSLIRVIAREKQVIYFTCSKERMI